MSGRQPAVNGPERAHFTYDGLGRCVKRTLDGATTIYTYDGWKPFMERNGNGGGVIAWNIYGSGPDEILWRYQVGVGHLRYHTDKEGSVTCLLDYNGNKLERYSYDAFGYPTVVSWTGSGWDEANPRAYSLYGNRFMFTGREFFGEMGIYDYRHRWYHPALGRFMQVDPMGLQTMGAKLSPEQTAMFPKGQVPETFANSEMNLFRYCGDDPMDRRDAYGLLPGDAFSSADEAARDVHAFINPTSISQNLEYGSVIYKMAGKYFATTPASGTRDQSFSRNLPPKGSDTVGDYHTHGDYSHKDESGRITRAARPGREVGNLAS